MLGAQNAWLLPMRIGTKWRKVVLALAFILVLGLGFEANSAATAYADTVCITLTALNAGGSQGTVGFDSACGKQMVTVEVEVGEIVELHAEAGEADRIGQWFFAPTFYRFSDGGDHHSIKALYDSDYYVCFYPEGQQYCYVGIAGNPDDSAGEALLSVVRKGEEFVLPENPFPTPNGLRFIGWDVNNGTILYPGESIEVGFDTNITPIWEPDESMSASTISFSCDRDDCIIICNGKSYGVNNPASMVPGQQVFVTVMPGDYGIGLFDANAEGIELHGAAVERTWGGHFWFTMPDHDCHLSFSMGLVEYFMKMDSNGGGGGGQTLTFHYRDEMTIPRCPFDSPTEKEFYAWEMEFDDSHLSPKIVKPGESVSMTHCDVILRALWADEPSMVHVHLLTEVVATAPTCETPGTEAYWKCSECGKLFADAESKEEISAPKEIATLGHDWGEWKVTKEPTATEEGEKTRVCKRDPSHTETMAIAPKGETEEPYEIAQTEELIWSPDDAEGMTITVVRADDGASTLAHFLGVSVDGVSVPPLGYTAEEGSLILTLKPAYLESLDRGSHRLDIRFDDGTVSAAFAIQEHADPAPAPAKSGLPTWAWILIGVAGAGVAGGVVLIFANRRGHAGGSQAHSRRTLTTRRR